MGSRGEGVGRVPTTSFGFRTLPVLPQMPSSSCLLFLACSCGACPLHDLHLPLLHRRPARPPRPTTAAAVRLPVLTLCYAGRRPPPRADRCRHATPHSCLLPMCGCCGLNAAGSGRSCCGYTGTVVNRCMSMYTPYETAPTSADGITGGCRDWPGRGWIQWTRGWPALGLGSRTRTSSC